MAGVNLVILVGNLTRDPELKFTPQGTALCKFGLAVSRKYKGSDGQMTEDVTFVNIVAWGKTGENCGKYLAKGRPVFIQGRLDVRTYEHEGQKKLAVEVVADTVQFLGSGQQQGAGGQGAQQGQQQPAATRPLDGDGDVPF